MRVREIHARSASSTSRSIGMVGGGGVPRARFLAGHRNDRGVGGGWGRAYVMVWEDVAPSAHTSTGLSTSGPSAPGHAKEVREQEEGRKMRCARFTLEAHLRPHGASAWWEQGEFRDPDSRSAIGGPSRGGWSTFSRAHLRPRGASEWWVEVEFPAPDSSRGFGMTGGGWKEKPLIWRAWTGPR